VFYTKGIVRHNSSVYFGEWRDGRHPPHRLPELYDVKRAETDGRGHEVQSSRTLSSKQGCYIKTPSLFDYAGAPDVERRILLNFRSRPRRIPPNDVCISFFAAPVGRVLRG
jgi:hypothetical protein